MWGGLRWKTRHCLSMWMLAKGRSIARMCLFQWRLIFVPSMMGGNQCKSTPLRWLAHLSGLIVGFCSWRVEYSVMVGATFALVSLCITWFMAAMDALKRSPWIKHWGSWGKKANWHPPNVLSCLPACSVVECAREIWILHTLYPFQVGITYSSVLLLTNFLFLFFLILWPSGQIINHYLWVSIDLYFWPSFS